MKTATPALFLLATLLKPTSALPIPSLSTSIATLRLYTPDPAALSHYAPTAQKPIANSAPDSSTMQIIVGQTLSLDHAPLDLSAIELVAVNAGRDLSSPPKYVGANSGEVVCEAKIAYSSFGVRFGMGWGPVAVGEGEWAEVTALECWVE